MAGGPAVSQKSRLLAPDQAVEEGSLFHFGPYRFDVKREELWREEVQVSLGRRGSRLLATLLTRAPSLVDKRELIELVWPGQAVEEANLTVQISALRRALGTEPWILTVPVRGYRFAGQVWRDGHAAKGALPALAGPSPGLPLQSTSFVGRQADLHDVTDLLRRGRLITLVGSGGVGKTRLAIESARRVAGEFGDDVRFVELALLREPGQVVERVAAQFGLARDNTQITAEGIADYLRQRRLLLLLDNCEHLLDEVARFAGKILRACPHVTLLATSRERLALAGEHAFQVPPLEWPNHGGSISAAEALEFPAVRLFADRAAGALSRYVLTDDDVIFVSRICQMVEGVALAIELVAPRVRLFRPAELLEQLTAGLDLLSHGDRSHLPRQQTIHATLEWSYDLLSRSEQSLLQRLSVVGGSFGLDTVRALSTISHEQSDPVLLLAALVEKSLVITADGPPERSRFRLTWLTRLHAIEKLSMAERTTWRRCHAEWLSVFYDGAEEAAGSVPFEQWRDEYRWDLDSLRASLEWAFSPGGDTLLACRLVSCTAPIWRALSLHSEYEKWLEIAVSRLPPEASPLTAGRIQLQLAGTAKNSLTQRAVAVSSAVGLLRKSRRVLLLAQALTTAYAITFKTDEKKSLGFLNEAELLQPSGPSRLGCRLLRIRAWISFIARENMQAQDFAAKATAMACALGCQLEQTLIRLVELEFESDASAAVRMFGSVESTLRRTGHTVELAFALTSVSAQMLKLGQCEAARKTALEGLSLALALQLPYTVAFSMLRLAEVAAFRALWARVARLVGYLGAVSHGEVVKSETLECHVEALARKAELALSPRSYRALGAEGAQWTQRQAILAVNGI